MGIDLRLDVEVRWETADASRTSWGGAGFAFAAVVGAACGASVAGVVAGVVGKSVNGGGKGGSMSSEGGARNCKSVPWLGDANILTG